MSILEGETNKRTRWIREAIQVRKLDKDVPMNRDEGGYQLPHLWDPLLRNPPKPPGRPRLRRSWHTPYRVCAGGGPKGGTSFVQSSEDEIHSYYTNSGSSQQKQFSCSEDGMLYTATETSAKGKKSFSVLTKEFIIVVIYYHRNETVLCKGFIHSKSFRMNEALYVVLTI